MEVRAERESLIWKRLMELWWHISLQNNTTLMVVTCLENVKRGREMYVVCCFQSWRDAMFTSVIFCSAVWKSLSFTLNSFGTLLCTFHHDSERCLGCINKHTCKFIGSSWDFYYKLIQQNCSTIVNKCGGLLTRFG